MNTGHFGSGARGLLTSVQVPGRLAHADGASDLSLEGETCTPAEYEG
jgi:hypothetical protein